MVIPFFHAGTEKLHFCETLYFIAWQLSPSPCHIESEYDAVFLLVFMARIGFDHNTAHALVKAHGIFVVRIAAAGKTADPLFPAVVLQDGKSAFPDPSVLIFPQHLQRMQPYTGAGILKHEISDLLFPASDQIHREGWV